MEAAFPGSEAPTAQEEGAPVPTPFSVVWLSDTQSMSYYRYPGALASMGSWIARERDARNILCVVQTGDAVDNGFSSWQWLEFDKCYGRFRDVLPYFAIAGNHDIGVHQGDYSAYLERDSVRELPQGNTFAQGRAAYLTFSAGGTHFLLLGAGWSSELEAADWMNGVLRAHPNDVAILLFHGYIQRGGGFTAMGKQMFERVVKPNPNVRLVLSGHVNGTAYRSDALDDDHDGGQDRLVSALMYNYQDSGMDCGQLRLLTFDPAARNLTVTTYSPYTERYYRDTTFHVAEFVLNGAF